jgi:hypothetical protein
MDAYITRTGVIATTMAVASRSVIMIIIQRNYCFGYSPFAFSAADTSRMRAR